jgi:hypothetical protein
LAAAIDGDMIIFEVMTDRMVRDHTQTSDELKGLVSSGAV